MQDSVAQDAATFSAPAAFDFITAFDAIHDQAAPRRVLRVIREALRLGGVFLMVDIAASTRLEDNLDNPLAPFLFTVSTMIDALRAAGLLRLFTPRAFGGLEIDPVTFARVAEEVSTFDSAAGWAFQVNTGAWWTSRMSPEGVAELYADGPDLMMAASFAPPHRAEEVPAVTESQGVVRSRALFMIPDGL